MKNTVKKIKELTKLLNKYCDAYYNGQELVSDVEYDFLYNELVKLETEVGYKMSSSPTSRVGYGVSNELPKITHDFPMLSLDKITTTEEILNFVDGQKAVMSLKEDGLSVRIIYNKNGDIESLSTRGDGYVGTNITSNMCAFTNIPLHISTNGKECIIDGEAICTFSNFERLNKKLEIPYKHPRAVASGTVSLLDPNEANKRGLDFIAWKFVQGSDKTSYGDRLDELTELGFDVVPWVYANKTNITECINILKDSAKILSHPYDGICVALDDTSIWDSLGATSKFPHHSKAYKFEQEAEETTIQSFEFSLGKSGQLTPVARFDTVVLDNTDVSKASCHNISYCKNLKLGIGAKVMVIKSMQIIPQIIECVEEGNVFEWPSTCPVCGGKTAIKKDNESEVLICTNPNCVGKKLAQFNHFVSRKCANIDGLSEATLEKFISLGYINDFKSIYKLSDHYDQLIKLDGFGPKSIEKLLVSIEKSRDIKLENFICALGIPNIGLSAAKTISKFCNGKYDNFAGLYFSYHMGNFNWTVLDDFGEVMAKSMQEYLEKNLNMLEELAAEMRFIVQEENDAVINNQFNGKSICVTGKLNSFTRDSINEKIVSLGAKAVGSVSKKTDYLITNEASCSSKYKKAMELNIPVITEEEFIQMIGE